MGAKRAFRRTAAKVACADIGDRRHRPVFHSLILISGTLAKDEKL